METYLVKRDLHEWAKDPRGKKMEKWNASLVTSLILVTMGRA